MTKTQAEESLNSLEEGAFISIAKECGSEGSQNAFKHGRYSRETIANRKETMMLIRQFKALLREISLI